MCSNCGTNTECNSSNCSVFCCSAFGSNNCPSGTSRTGWWRCLDSSCAGGSRYYIDCAVPSGTSCNCTCPNGCNGKPACKHSCVYDNCSSCSNFGKIKCRIVRCSDPSCGGSGPLLSGGCDCQCGATCC